MYYGKFRFDTLTDRERSGIEFCFFWETAIKIDLDHRFFTFIKFLNATNGRLGINFGRYRGTQGAEKGGFSDFLHSSSAKSQNIYPIQNIL
jgi:hypothetical protein